MGLDNRTRDFTDDTVADINNRLKGETGAYRGFTKWWEEYGVNFDSADCSIQAQSLDSELSRVRYIMSELAPAQLAVIMERVELAEQSAESELLQTVEKLDLQSKALSKLTAQLQLPGLLSGFDSSSVWEDIAGLFGEKNARFTEKLEFIQTMQEEYGFDAKAAMLLWKLKKALEESGEISGDMFFAVLGAFCYGVGDGDMAWQVIFSLPYSSPEAEKRFFIVTLGFTEAEYNYLRYKVRVQNQITGNSGKWNPEAADMEIGKADYITAKANLEKALGRELSDSEFQKLWREQYNAMTTTDAVGNRIGRCDFGHMMATMGAQQSMLTYLVSENAGWLGDTTIGDPPSIKNDDYIADLDAVNLKRLMRENGWSYERASAEYFKGIKNGTYNRAEEFLKTTPLPEVKQKIFDGCKAPKECQTEAQKMQWLKENCPDSWNFIMNLQAENNEMQDYT